MLSVFFPSLCHFSVFHTHSRLIKHTYIPLLPFQCVGGAWVWISSVWVDCSKCELKSVSLCVSACVCAYCMHFIGGCKCIYTRCMCVWMSALTALGKCVYACIQVSSSMLVLLCLRMLFRSVFVLTVGLTVCCCGSKQHYIMAALQIGPALLMCESKVGGLEEGQGGLRNPTE